MIGDTAMTNRAMQKNDILGEVLFEFIPHGNFVKVIAVDPITNTEIIIVGDRRAGRQTLQMTAMQKLRYVILKNMENKTVDIENSGNSF